MSVTFQGEPVKGSPFELRVHCVSAEKSRLEVNVTDTVFGPMYDGNIKVTVTAVDQDGTPLTQGGDKFTATLSVNGQPQVFQINSVLLLIRLTSSLDLVEPSCDYGPEQRNLHCHPST